MRRKLEKMKKNLYTGQLEFSKKLFSLQEVELETDVILPSKISCYKLRITVVHHI